MNERLTYLFDRYFDQSITNEEKVELFDLIELSKDHQSLTALIDRSWNSFDGSGPDVISEVRFKQIFHGIVADTSESIREKPVHRIHFLRTTWLRYAAAIIILFGIGAYLYTSQQKKSNLLSAENLVKVDKNDIAPGTNKAMLTLSDGSVIILDSAANGQIAVQQGASVIKKDGNILYDPNQISSKEVVYNTMSTPRGGQYQLTLPDGTQVWLNAASSITYPIAFIGKQRIVKITGEVYFEVQKDASKPFIVQTYKDEIKVLGTQFNVNAYVDEPFMKTSLLEGSVQVKDKILKPGQAYIDGAVTKTNTTEDIAWKNGFFSFRKADIKDIMRQLSRWYDVQVNYKNIVPGGEFTGKIGKDLTLAQVMRLLGKARINFEIEGKTITILP